jgi:hypothetical protein
VTGLVNQELLLKNEYLLAENRVLKAHLPPRFRLSRPERTTLAEIGKRLGRKLSQQVAGLANADTILGWFRKLVAEKFDGSRDRRSPGRPRIAVEIEDLVIRLARGNSGRATTGSWERWPTWVTRYRMRPWATSCVGTASSQHRRGAEDHLEGLHPAAYGGPRWHRLLHGRSAGITEHPDASWMCQVARNATY